MYELQEMLKDVTGMQGVSLTPMAGAQGELAGVAMIKAYHDARGDTARNEIIVPDAAHGTNPASAAMAVAKPEAAKSAEASQIIKVGRRGGRGGCTRAAPSGPEPSALRPSRRC